jgi:hypothetical protein
MPLAEFELTVPRNERPQTHALDRAATGIGWDVFKCGKYYRKYKETCFVTDRLSRNVGKKLSLFLMVGPIGYPEMSVGNKPLLAA